MSSVVSEKVTGDGTDPCIAATIYRRQVAIGSWIMYSFILVLIAVAAGVALRIGDSDKELYEMSIFFVVLLFVVVIIGAYVLTLTSTSAL